MRPPRTKTLASFVLAAILSVPAWCSDTSANSALPGTVNYVEGQASIGDQPLNSKSIGSAELQPGQSLNTQKGKAEILLTPGVFLRVGANSSVKMISPSLTDTEIGVDKGHAMIEVAEIHPENDIRVTEGGTTTQLLKTGLYDFGRNQEFRVFDGKASVEDGSEHSTVKGGHEVSLADNSVVKTQKFEKKAFEEGDLYRWSSLRSAYLAEANIDAAHIYAAGGWGPRELAGGAPTGIGIPGLVLTRSFPATEYSTARSAGVFIRRDGSTKRLSTDIDTGVVSGPITTISVPMRVTGARVFTTLKPAITRTASTGQVLAVTGFIQGRGWGSSTGFRNIWWWRRLPRRGGSYGVGSAAVTDCCGIGFSPIRRSLPSFSSPRFVTCFYHGR